MKTIFIIVEVQRRCCGHGEAEEIVVMAAGPAGVGTKPPAFTHAMAALQWLREQSKEYQFGKSITGMEVQE